MVLPLTADPFYGVFSACNLAVWPMQWVLMPAADGLAALSAAGVMLIVFALRAPRSPLLAPLPWPLQARSTG